MKLFNWELWKCMQVSEGSGVRIDKWLWAVRVYKTRSLAAAACRAGHVRVGDKAVKPARLVLPGDVVTAKAGRITRTIKATTLVNRRVGAKMLERYIEDLTPASEYNKGKEFVTPPKFSHSKKRGRPTKRDRRALDRFGAEW